MSADINSPEFSQAAAADRIPLWVADMGFATAPSVLEAVRKRLEHPVFGYYMPSEEYYSAIINWQRQSYASSITRECIGYENSVLGGVSSALHILEEPGTPILLHSPTYNGFIQVMSDNGYPMILSPLRTDSDGVPRMDIQDMEQKIQSFNIHTVLLSSPHNPSGRVWERWELEEAMELFRRYDLNVISDEIWSDLTLYGNRHIPTRDVSADAARRTIAFYAPTKTFNIASIIGSYSIVTNPQLRERLDKYEQKSHYNNMNVLSMHALTGAYSPQGMDWLQSLKKALEKNIDLADTFFNSIKGVSMYRPQGTYIVSPDFSKWCENHGKTLSGLAREGIGLGVMWRDGKYYNMPNGMRLCLAQPYSLVEQAFRRLRTILA